MRDIKFRAWHKKEKIFLKNGSISLSGNKTFHEEIWYGPFFIEGEEHFLPAYKDNYKEEDIELSQYTGLKDKNGKEIYDGDLISICGIDNEQDDFNGENIRVDNDIVAHVELKNKGYLSFYLNIIDSEDVPFSYFNDLIYYRIEVLGNIYENPKLLDDDQIRIKIDSIF